MAAPMLSKSQANKSLRANTTKKKAKKTKDVLKSALELTWSKLEESVELAILKRLQSTIEPLGISKVQSTGKHRGKKENTDAFTVQQQKATCNKEIRDLLLIGVNQVTKGLERDQVRLVLTCSSAKPPVLIQHLIGLSAARKCPAVCISGLSLMLGTLMNLKSAIAIGFKKKADDEKTVFDDVIHFISEHVPDSELPWMESIESEEKEEHQKNDKNQSIVFISDSKTLKKEEHAVSKADTELKADPVVNPAKKRKVMNSDTTLKFSSFQPASVIQIYPNENRVLKQNKKKKRNKFRE